MTKLWKLLSKTRHILVDNQLPLIALLLENILRKFCLHIVLEILLPALILVVPGFGPLADVAVVSLLLVPGGVTAVN